MGVCVGFDVSISGHTFFKARLVMRIEGGVPELSGSGELTQVTRLPEVDGK